MFIPEVSNILLILISSNPADLIVAKATVFDLLEPYFVRDALYNSGKREEEKAAMCQEGTRIRILQEIRQWADGAGHPVCWLSGPAGTGKTTIAHTIAEEYNRNGRLAATFFFWRKTGDRDDIRKLIPTLAYQMAEKIPLAKEGMQIVLITEPTVPSLELRSQLAKLVIRPISNFREVHRWLVIIDGLDECSSRDGISNLIRLLGEMTNAHGYSFRFLLTSRPEPDIKDAFASHLAGNTALWLALHDSIDDIRTFLRSQLSQVRKNFRLESSWPSNVDLESMVEKSEGLFIHAATAVRYINDRRGFPKERLQQTLQLHTGVDSLYAQVITEAKKWAKFDIVLGSLMYLREPLAIDNLSELLGLEVTEIRVALGGCHSVLTIPEDSTETIRPHHASLRDFLTDEERSKDLFFAPATCHATLMIYCLKAITKAFRDGNHAPEYASTRWYYHTSLLLSEANAGKDLGLESDTQVQQIDLKWLEFWMADALCWGELPYSTHNLLSSIVSWVHICTETFSSVAISEGYSRATLVLAHQGKAGMD
jgi:hypothetical protein